MCWQISRFTDIFSQVGLSPVQKQTQVSLSFTGNTGVLLLHNIIAHVKHTKDISSIRTYVHECPFWLLFCWKWCKYKKIYIFFILLYITSFIIYGSWYLILRKKHSSFNFLLNILSLTSTLMWKVAFFTVSTTSGIS